MLNSAVLVSAWNKSYSMVEIRTIETFGNLVWNHHAKWHENSSLVAILMTSSALTTRDEALKATESRKKLVCV